MSTSVRLLKETERRLDALALSTGRSKAFYIREAIEEYLDDLENVYLAEQTLERIRRGEEKTYSLAEVEKHFDLVN